MQRFGLVITLLFCACLPAIATSPGAALACPACWAGYGSGDERYNKPLADLRIEYEAKGRGALPYIRNTIKTSSDPLVINRAAGYLVDLDDKEALPLLMDMVKSIAKRVAFGSFGLRSYEFKGRMAAAHAVSALGSGQPTADFIWGRLKRMPLERKEEVPYLLSALDDTRFENRMLNLLDRREGHQLMVNAMEALKISGGPDVVKPLQQRIDVWANTADKPGQSNKGIFYSVLTIKGLQTCAALADKKP
jgi:hypothetical protein